MTMVEDVGARLGAAEYLVRHHALESLAKVGDALALAALRGSMAGSPHEAELAEQAIRSIQRRAGR